MGSGFVFSQPLLGLIGSHAGDGLLGVLGFGAAEGVQEELAALGLVQALFVAGGITEFALSALGNELGGFGIVFDLANDLLHGDNPFFAASGR